VSKITLPEAESYTYIQIQEFVVQELLLPSFYASYSEAKSTMNDTYDTSKRILECHPPDACTNDIREENLIQRQQKDDHRSTVRRILERDRNLLIACIVLVIAMNTTEGRYLLYPFRIFSTWVHEMCHGIASILMGGSISKLEIFKDGSGLAYTRTPGDWRKAFVSSGGYPGTAVTGCILLLFRRTTLGPTIGTIGLGCASC
jgi:hypothetical protein